jgi:hypothetical protein
MCKVKLGAHWEIVANCNAGNLKDKNKTSLQEPAKFPAMTQTQLNAGCLVV